jgi:hypothetical protein
VGAERLPDLVEAVHRADVQRPARAPVRGARLARSSSP